MIKTSLILLVSLFYLISCDGNKKANPEGEKAAVKQIEPIKLEKKDPEPQTITLKEVSRIALVEAKQFLTQAKEQNIDVSSVVKTYDEAQAAYDKGEFKMAQVLAVKARQNIEDYLRKK